MVKEYQLSIYFHEWILNDLDKEQRAMLEHHVASQDYFGTLATILHLINQEQHIDNVVFDEMVEELNHLQDHYAIRPKK